MNFTLTPTHTKQVPLQNDDIYETLQKTVFRIKKTQR